MSKQQQFGANTRSEVETLVHDLASGKEGASWAPSNPWRARLRAKDGKLEGKGLLPAVLWESCLRGLPGLTGRSAKSLEWLAELVRAVSARIEKGRPATTAGQWVITSKRKGDPERKGEREEESYRVGFSSRLGPPAGTKRKVQRGGKSVTVNGDRGVFLLPFVSGGKTAGWRLGATKANGDRVWFTVQTTGAVAAEHNVVLASPAKSRRKLTSAEKAANKRARAKKTAANKAARARERAVDQRKRVAEWYSAHSAELGVLSVDEKVALASEATRAPVAVVREVLTDK